MTTWGREIAVNGVRPKWLADDDEVCGHAGFGDAAKKMVWETFHTIRLPAKHWAYRALDAGFEPWSGGDKAPDDWDGGEVMLRNGVKLSALDQDDDALWCNDGMFVDIVGYHKKPSTETGYDSTPIATGFKVSSEPILGTDDTDYVRVKRMTESEARKLWIYQGCETANTFVSRLKALGLIKPDPTPLDRFMSAHPTADRATAELVMKWRDGE